MRYPEYANINGERYKLKTDFRVGLRCFEVINDPGICDEERALAVVYLLFGFIPEDNLIEQFLLKAKTFLQCGESDEEQREKKRDMDFTHDQKYITASFMSDYKIDLSKTEMHFWQFIELIQGLTEHSVLSRVREIRNYDLTEVKDAKSRAKIAKMQAELALPIRHTQDELDAWEEFESLFEGAKT